MQTSEQPGIARNKQLNGGVPKGWRLAQKKALRINRISDAAPPLMFAMISTWFDGDIIEATVKNCFAQGCSKVFILDNDSPDDTASNAKKAGAEIARVYSTKYYDDDWRITVQNELVRDITERTRVPELWWMVLDADELLRSMMGEPLIETLTGLPKEIRAIGSNYIDLYPLNEVAYLPGQHPAEVMHYGMWRRGGIYRYMCCGHWKHNVIRLFNGNFDMCTGRGNHQAYVPLRGNQLICEPDFDIFGFHVPIRSKECAYKRLSALCDNGRNEWDDQVTNNQGAIKRRNSLDAIFAGKWASVEIPHSIVCGYGRDVQGVALYEWKKLVERYQRKYLAAL